MKGCVVSELSESFLSMRNPVTLKNEFVKILKEISRYRDKRQVFNDWLEVAALTLHQLPYHSGDLPKDTAFDQIEAQYLESIKGYKPNTLQGMAKMLHITNFAHEIGAGDFLGEIAAEEEMLNEEIRQFFTPYSVCRMMAKMIVGDVRAQVEEKGILTVSEPAVGGGALVIAVAEEITSQGIDPRSCVQFDCVDVSKPAFNMAYIQLSALGLQAMLRHGNTLSMEMWEHRPTMQLRLFHKWLEQHREAHQQQQRLEMMRDILVDPEGFFAQRNIQTNTEANTQTNNIQAPATESPPVESVPEATLPTAIAEQIEQGSLFETEDLTEDKATDPRKRRRSADIELPPSEQRQLDIFSQERE